LTTLSVDAVSYCELTRVSASLGSGTHVVLGAEHDGAAALIELAAGLAVPDAGRITLDGKAPFSHARVRQRVAALCAVEQLPPARTVGAALTLALRARGDARSAATVLDSAGLAHFAARQSATLSAREVRALAGLLALSHPEPSLCALFEPLALLGTLDEAFVLQALARAAAAGAIVLATASRVEDALRIGGASHVLERGAWLDPAKPRLPLAEVILRVRTPEPRRLAARLAEAPDVSGVEWPGGKELLVRGRDLERVAAHVVASARSESIRIEALRYEPPSLEALAAARAGNAQAWYERAQREPRSYAPNAEPQLVQTRGLQ
jgi:ABC-type multidrug transport system ATPase subunit